VRFGFIFVWKFWWRQLSIHPNDSSRASPLASKSAGLGPNLAGVTPEKAIKLAANDLLRCVLIFILYYDSIN
jgi:hypothetical protein